MILMVFFVLCVSELGKIQLHQSLSNDIFNLFRTLQLDRLLRMYQYRLDNDNDNNI